MQKYILSTLMLGLTACAVWSQDAMPKINQTTNSFKRKISQKVASNYLLFLPKDYKAKSTNRWPLIIFLHGAGERGTNASKVAVHGPPKIVKEMADFPFIVISPQCPSGQTWSNDVLLALLDEVTKKLAVDKSRIYLTGLSMGGFGTWSLGLTHPDRFAAIAPICGGGNSIDILLPDPKMTKALKSLPVWAFHGAKDDTVKSSESERMVEALKKIGNDAKLTVYPEAGHDSWTQTYNNAELYDWFLRHKKK
jgi:predicted peptidase